MTKEENETKAELYGSELKGIGSPRGTKGIGEVTREMAIFEHQTSDYAWWRGETCYHEDTYT